MIVKMNKISLICLDSNREEHLNELKKLGVVHLEKVNGFSEKLTSLEDQCTMLNVSLLHLSLSNIKRSPKKLSMQETLDTAEKIISLAEEKRTALDNLERSEKEISKLAEWGDFNPRDIRELGEKGINIKLYRFPKKDFLKSESKKGFVVNITKKSILFALAEKGESEPLPDAEEFQLPEKGLSELNIIAKEIKKNISDIDKKIELLSEIRSEIKKYINILNDKIEYEEIRSGLSVDGSISYLTGFVPIDKIDLLKETASKNSWALLIQNPTENDNPPTQIKNNKFIRIIQPLFDMLGTIPGYNEYDISSYFLVFFSLFFAMIIGDAGYGSIFLIAAVGLNIKLKKLPDALKLLYLLSISTIVWGAITGTWFGSEEIAVLKPFKYFIVPSLYSYNPASGDTIKYFCFIVGTLQISIAHIKNFIKQMPSLKALSQLGWLSTVLGLYHLVLNLVLDPNKYPLPQYSLYMIGAGMIFVIVFAQQEGNFFKGLLKGITGLLTTFLDGVSALSDIISYIRLYAVGLATITIAQSFNNMAAQFGTKGIAIVAFIIVILFGHILNLAMGALSVVVHGVRLNLLEFSGHLGMEWTGIKYEPFKVIENKND